MISPQTIQQITSRIDILDIVGEFVRLKKRGASYLGLCPFHNEKTPSFTVSPSREIYKCFGCGKSGNSITFLMEHEKYTYVEALRWLAARYNIEIEETAVSPEALLAQQAAESLYAINSFAQRFFSEQLQSPDGVAVALSYLEERGFSEDVIKKFQLGYCPRERTVFSKAAIQQQFNPELLVKSGLVVRRDDELVDNYRGRIIFPVHNNTGKIIGFGARVIGQADRAPKYINTPENELYVKSRILYGSYFARHAIDKEDECLLVEGYTDVISLHQAGVENVVASGGTSLTADQLRLIRKYTDHLTIIYDGDAAGIKAALRGLDMALEEGLDVRLVLIPDKEDPDSYVRKVGAGAFRKFIAAEKKDFVLFQLDVMLKEAGNDVTRKNSVVNQVAETLSRISKAEDFTRQQEYIRQCASILHIDENGLTALVNKYKRDRVSRDERKLPFEEAEQLRKDAEAPSADTDTALLLNQDELQEKSLVRVLLEYGLNRWDEQRTIADYIFSELEQFSFDNPDYERLTELYRTRYQEGTSPTARTLLYEEDGTLRELIANITLFPFELSQRWDEKLENMQVLGVDNSVKDVFMSMHYFKLKKIKRMFDQNQEDIRKATTPEEIRRQILIHTRLKEMEREMSKEFGTVIFR